MTNDRLGLLLLLSLTLLPHVASAQGLSVYRAQAWDQEQLQIPDDAEAGDGLGRAVAAGDFDDDGFDDLAIGVPDEDLDLGLGNVHEAGAVIVLYGAPGGLGFARAQFWHQDSPGVAGQVEEHDFFGHTLAAGDFNGDAYDDLAIGVLSEDLPGAQHAGAVEVLYGGASGLDSVGDQLWSQDDPAVQGTTGYGELFGAALAAGDFDGDGYADLAIGAPTEGTRDPDFFDGGVNVLFGSAVGLTADGDQYFRGRDFPPTDQDGGLFGQALSSGDFDGDGFADLAIGAPGDDFVGLAAVGSVRLLFGSAAGLTTDRDLYLLGPEEWGRQGEALAAGDLDGDGDDDLVIGIPGRTVAGNAAAGAIAVGLGDGGGLADGGEWSQETPGVQGTAEPSDGFGAALAIGDFDRDGRADLAVGVFREDLQEADEGAVQVLFGAASGLTATGDQLWLRDGLPPPDPSAGDALEYFGFALAVGDFDGTGHPDLAVGMPGEALTTPGNAGAVYVLHGSLFADDFESGDTARWSLAGP